MSAASALSAVSAAVVMVLHTALVAFVLAAPFSTDDSALAACVFLLPMLWIHWLLNDDTCFLTIVECRLRGLQPSQSFIHRLVSPVYKIRDEHVRLLAWVGSVGLWVVAVVNFRRLRVWERLWDFTTPR